MATKNVVKATTGAELLSYIINVTPELRDEIDLPVQGESIRPIGKIIVNNERYKNAFLNTINVIGLTVITRNNWSNPWESFTNKGMLEHGQSIRELFVEIAEVFDYNETVNDSTNFLNTVVPNVFNYIHELNYQKYYKTTTSDAQISMAFATEDGLFDLIDNIIGSLYRGYEYDKYIVNKYMLCRRILDGTVPSVQIEDYDNLSADEIVTIMKNYSSKMTFMSPNYNPAGVRKSTPFIEQYLISNTEFDAKLTTQVLAKSYFRNDAEFKTNLALIDGFDNHDIARLTDVLGSQFIEFTESELEQLKNIPAMIIGYDFFQNRNYALDNQSEVKRTDFYNPETLKRTHWLHTWKALSTSPFENCLVFSKTKPSVTSVSVTPATATLPSGASLQLNASVVTAGFANKAVLWSVSSAKASITSTGMLTVSSDAVKDETITVTATSIYDNTKKGTTTITVA